VIAMIIAGAALALPVPVLALSNGSREIVAPLEEGEALTYSYRQSIYDVPVYEDFVRRGDAIDLLRVRSPDIRSIEYFHWDGDPSRDTEGLWMQDAPPSEHAELVVRIAPLGQQRLTTSRWSYSLLPLFGETVVTIRVAKRPNAVSILERAK
jgi:hypothetical protein